MPPVVIVDSSSITPNAKHEAMSKTKKLPRNKKMPLELACYDHFKMVYIHATKETLSNNVGFSFYIGVILTPLFYSISAVPQRFNTMNYYLLKDRRYTRE